MYMHIFIAMFKQRLNILNSIMSGLRLQITFVFRHGGGGNQNSELEELKNTQTSKSESQRPSWSPSSRPLANIEHINYRFVSL